jgi:hypothetical protein
MEVYHTGTMTPVQYCTKRAVAVGGGDYKEGEDPCPHTMRQGLDYRSTWTCWEGD